VSATERNIHLGLLGAALAVAAWVFAAQPRAGEPATHGRALSSATREPSPLELIPPGSAFVLSADLRSFARAPLGAFIAQRLERSAGANKLQDLCGFDPLLRLDRLALAVPSANFGAREQPEDFGIIASGRFRAEELTRCASAGISARSDEPIQTKIGRFDSVRSHKPNGGEIAAKDGLVIVSGGSYFRELLDSAERGQRHSKPDARDARHTELRRALGPGALLATWLLGEGWFERVAGSETNARLSPLSALESVGLRIDFKRTAELLLLLECADGEGAARISNLLDELRSSLAMFPLDPALVELAKRITVNRAGARLKLELELNQAELSPVLEALLGP